MSEGAKSMPFAVGRRIPQLESVAKITGTARYTHDITLPGMLYCAIVRSSHASARIVDIDTTIARAMSGVVDIVVAGDFADAKYVNYGPFYADRYALARDVVRFHGEEVAAIAAETLGDARAAARSVRVRYAPLPAAVTVDEALAHGAHPIHPPRPNLPPNVVQDVDVTFGDPDAGFAGAALVVEGTFEHGIVWPVCLETNAAVASYDKQTRSLQVWAGTQAPFFVRKELACVLGMPPSSIVVRSVAVGGGFGGKSQSPEQIAIAALLSRRTGRPVKVVLSRDEEYVSGKTDHGKRMSLRTAVDREGNILARSADAVIDNGAYTHMGPVYVSAVRQRTTNLYRVGAAAVRAKLVYTNKVPGGSYRGMGAPGIIWAIESQVDEIAQKLGLDPVEYRLRIANQPGDVTPLGWQITTCGLSECIRKAADAIGWQSKHGKLPPFRGVGIASMIHPSGSVLYAEGNFSNIAIDMRSDGRLQIATQTADAGTGQNTILAQLVAEELGISVDGIDVVHMDTELAPDDLGSAASRVTFVSGNAAIAAARDLVARVKRRIAEDWRISADDVNYHEGLFTHPREPSREVALNQFAQRYGEIRAEGRYEIDLKRPDPVTGFGNYAAAYAFGAQAVEVEVDPETGHISVIKVASVQDVGRVINPTALEGQTYGGIVQGIGMALGEEVVFEAGRPVNKSLFNYRVPRIMDTPDIDVQFVETEDGEGPFGAKAAGEPTINATIAAVANAVANALGIRFHKLPIKPEDVLRALAGRDGSAPALKPYLRPHNAEVSAVRAAYPVMFPAMQRLGRVVGRTRPVGVSSRTVAAVSITDAIDTLARNAGRAKLIGGGTDLLPGIRQGVYAPEILVDLSRIPTVQQIDITDQAILIGAGTTLSALQDHTDVERRIPGLAKGIELLATRQIRNRATVAGDLCQEKRCWFFRTATPCYRFSGPACPCYAVLGDNRHHAILGAGRCAAPCVSDLAPMFTALGAVLSACGPNGTRRIPVEKLYVWAGETVLRPDEVITTVEIPFGHQPFAFHFEKYARWTGDFAEASAAVAVSGSRDRITEVVISLGGVAPTPMRAHRSEKTLTRHTLSSDLIRTAAEAAVHGALPLRDNGYKTRLAITVTERAIRAAVDAL